MFTGCTPKKKKKKNPPETSYFLKASQRLTSSVFKSSNKKDQRIQNECCCFWRTLLFSICPPPSPHWYLSFTSLHLSFHLLLFSVFPSPRSLLRARKLQLKLSQSGAQLRLPGDLTGKDMRMAAERAAKSTSCFCVKPTHSTCRGLLELRTCCLIVSFETCTSGWTGCWIKRLVSLLEEL